MNAGERRDAISAAWTFAACVADAIAQMEAESLETHQPYLLLEHLDKHEKRRKEELGTLASQQNYDYLRKMFDKFLLEARRRYHD